MSYSSMSPPQKPAPAPPYPQYPNSAGSPTNPSPYGPPPAKRQRMSPDIRSPPNGAVGWAHPPHGLPMPGPYAHGYGPPNSTIQSPYANSPIYGSPRENSFNMPQPYPYQQPTWQSHPPPSAQPRQSSPPSQQSRESMPPPPVPKREEREERVGVEDFGDSLFGSGINLKDEENYMHAMYNNRHQHFHPRDSQSFSTNQNTSFGSSTMSPSNSFNLLTQGTSFGSQDAGTLGRARTEEDIELEQRRKRETAARAKAERDQHHLNHQFLQCNNVRKRMDKLAREQGVGLIMHGVYLLSEPQTTAMVNGAGSTGIVSTKEEPKKPESVVSQNTPFDHIFSLISLAAGERMRGLLDDAYTLARARRYGDHGRVVPPEFADIAEGDGKGKEDTVIPESITGTQWDRTADQDNVLSKNPDMADGIQKPVSASATPQPQPTVAFQGTLNAQLRAIVARDRQAEADRLKKRAARKRKASEMAGTSDTPPTDAAAPEATTAPIEQPKLSKKEQMRQNKEKNSNTEAQLHQSTNQTAAMMATGKKMKKYGWMQGAASSMPTNRYAKPTTSANASGTATPIKPGNGSGAVTPGGIAMAKTGSAQGSGEAKAAEWGDWRETGKGIELRDWVLVLERDGREKAALYKALYKVEE